LKLFYKSKASSKLKLILN